MKIYLADTIQREHLDYNKKLYIYNHLESYWALLKQNKNMKDWSVYEKSNKSVS